MKNYRTYSVKNSLANGGVFKPLSVKRKSSALEMIGNISPQDVFSSESFEDENTLSQEYEVLKSHWEEMRGKVMQTEIEDKILSQLDICFDAVKQIINVVEKSHIELQQDTKKRVEDIIDNDFFSRIISIFPSLGIFLYSLFVEKINKKTMYVSTLYGVGDIDPFDITKEEKFSGDIFLHAFLFENRAELSQYFPNIHLFTELLLGKVSKGTIPDISGIKKEVFSERFFLMFLKFLSKDRDYISILRYIYDRFSISLNFFLAGDVKRAETFLFTPSNKKD